MEQIASVHSGRLKRVLVIVKETYLELVQAANDSHQLEEIAKKSPGLESVAESHAQHVATLETIETHLKDRGVSYAVLHRRDVALAEELARATLVITVGGDGTFLTASHDIFDETPVLGVNSAPITSFGHYCVCDRDTFAATLASIESGAFKPVRLLRLALSIDQKAVPELVLNEVLVAHEQPAGTSRYHITAGDTTEIHKCSGLLVSTPAGSTGFLRSEGGPVLAIDAQEFAFRERAPFLRLDEEHALSCGVMRRGERLDVISQMKGGRIYVDGDYIQYDFGRGAKLTIEAAPSDLLAYVDSNCHKPFIQRSQNWVAWLKSIFN